MNETQSFFYLEHIDKFLHFTRPFYATLFYKNFKLNLETGEKEFYSIDELRADLEQKKFIDHFNEPIVYHFYYELGYLIQNLETLVKDSTPLYVKIHYQNVDTIDFDNPPEKDSVSPKDYPRYKEYKEKFNLVQKHLRDGNCYQINLTEPFYLKFENWTPLEFMQSVWSDKKNRAFFAHSTYIHSLDKLFLSNSPECLFKFHDDYLYSLPIKGTRKVEHDSEREFAFTEMSRSKKEEAELFMISDLVRNDLTAVEMIPSEVKAKKERLDVPSIVHQFSILRVKLTKEANLYQALSALFPGGSITGAPKLNVMKYINEIEGYERGFYCGSTMLLYKNIKSASINIRSSEIDFNLSEIKYGAGGGITLLSESRSEFDELFAKMYSFLQLIKLTP